VQGREWERFAWLKSRVVAPRASVDQRPRAGAARAGHALRLPALPGLRRVRGPAPAAPQDPRRGPAPRRRPARARQRRQAVARRHPRDRVHRAAAAGGARRPVPRDPHPLDAARAAAAGRRPDEARDRRAAGRVPTLPAPRRAPHPVPGRPADPPAARRRRRPGLDRAQPGPADARARRPALLDRLGEVRETGGHRVRRAAARRRTPAPGRNGCKRLRQRAAAGGQRAAARPAAPALAERVRQWASSRGCRRCATRASCGWAG
jgi:glutamate-ammonia-ligase adenylyltransferase